MGFPGETDADFEILLEFLESAQLDRVGCFQYSPVAGAKANELPDHVAAEIKQERWERFMATQQRISESRLGQKIGKTMSVIVDSIENEKIIARSHADAPEIDGTVIIEATSSVAVGELVEVKIVESDKYDLYATLI